MGFAKQLWSIVVLTFFLIIYGCTQHIKPNIHVNPKDFKFTLPYEVNKKGIAIDTYWGKNKIKHKLLWDNHSPTWANENVIRDNKSISKSKDFLYRTTTAEGAPIQGDVYICDSITIGPVTFQRVPFYKISNKMEGVIGENVISKGVWKIDFDKGALTFASSIDSLEGLQQAELFPAEFTKNAIKIEVAFQNNIVKDVDLDFGFNGGIIMPLEMFKQVVKGYDRTYKASTSFSTPTGSTPTENIHAFDTIKIKKNNFSTTISSNELVKEILIGRRFFEQFEFVIIDYINRVIYVNKKSKN